jgi:type I restriction enzyme S subunit
MDYIDDYLFEGLHLLIAEDGSVETERGTPFLQLVDGRFWVNNHAHVLKGETDTDTRYLFFALSSIPIRPFMTGSVQPKLSQTNLNNVPIPYPSVYERSAIAHILGTLDDKIELNRQMNQTLEAMAQALFKSWFVDFEPFRDQGMQDSPQGEIPVGWRVGKLEEIAVLHRESINPSDYPNEVFDHCSIPAFDEGRMPKAETGDEIRSNKFRIPNGAVLISKLNPRFPRAWLPLDIEHRRSICSTEFLVVTPRGDSGREYFYSLFCSARFLATFSTLVTGTSSSHQRVRPEDLMSIDLVIPPGKVISSFSDKVRPLLTLVNHNLAENGTLASSREALLPKLLSGEIRVKDAEKFVEEKI